jgi:putative hydrolase of the HAD superfamily
LEKQIWEKAVNSGNGHKPNDPSQIQAVILDYGEVLCVRPERHALSSMANVFGIEPTRFFELYGTRRDPYDQGVISAEQYWRDFARRAGAEVNDSLIQQLRSLDTQMWSSTNPEMLQWVAMLDQAGLTTALLSNMQHDMAAYARKNFPWLKHFDHQILSCELQLIKPDPAIFHKSIERIGAKPEEILFIDDRQPNIDSARSTGIAAIRFENTKQLRQELREMKFPVLPAVAEPEEGD